MREQPITRYLQRTLAGEATTPQDWNEHLVAFHQNYLGATENLLARMHTSAGENSYETLAARIKSLAPTARDILDLGCGDGTLLDEIARRFGPGVALTGIDLSATEIERARLRLPSATFVVGNVLGTDMSQKSQDVVTSHLAFMAMTEIGRVFARTREALRAPGVLVFVSEDPLAGKEIFALLTRAIEIMRDRYPRFVPSVPHREPIEREDELRGLLEREGFTRISIEPLEVRGRLSTDDLWRFVEQSYPFGLLDDTMRSGLQDALRAQIASLASGAEPALALRLVIAHT